MVAVPADALRRRESLGEVLRGNVIALASHAIGAKQPGAMDHELTFPKACGRACTTRSSSIARSEDPDLLWEQTFRAFGAGSCNRAKKRRAGRQAWNLLAENRTGHVFL